MICKHCKAEIKSDGEDYYGVVTKLYTCMSNPAPQRSHEPEPVGNTPEREPRKVTELVKDRGPRIDTQPFPPAANTASSEAPKLSGTEVSPELAAAIKENNWPVATPEAVGPQSVLEPRPKFCPFCGRPLGSLHREYCPIDNTALASYSKQSQPQPMAEQWAIKRCPEELNAILRPRADWILYGPNSMSLFFSDEELEKLATGHLQIVPLAARDSSDGAERERTAKLLKEELARTRRERDKALEQRDEFLRDGKRPIDVLAREIVETLRPTDKPGSSEYNVTWVGSKLKSMLASAAPTPHTSGETECPKCGAIMSKRGELVKGKHIQTEWKCMSCGASTGVEAHTSAPEEKRK